MADRIDWQSAPCVFVRRIRCPHCDTTERPIITRTERNYAEQLRRYICRVCSGPFTVVVGDDPEDQTAVFSGE